MLKQSLASSSKLHTKTIIFEGLGYEFFFSKKKKFLILRLNYSHLIALKIPSSIFLYSQNSKQLSGFSFDNFKLSQWFHFIKNMKVRDKYKKKGIFFLNEKIILKKGKQNK